MENIINAPKRLCRSREISLHDLEGCRRRLFASDEEKIDRKLKWWQRCERGGWRKIKRICILQKKKIIQRILKLTRVTIGHQVAACKCVRKDTRSTGSNNLCTVCDTAQKEMCSYEIEFLKEFSNHCRDLESKERRVDDVDKLMAVVHSIYDDSLSGKLPTLPENLPARKITPTLGKRQGSQKDKASFVKTEGLSLDDGDGKITIEDALKLFRSEVFNTSNNSLSGYQFGSVCNSTCFVSTLATSIAAYIPLNNARYVKYPGACEVEFSVVKWLCSVVGYGEGSCGYLTSGASVSTVHGFMVARDECLAKVTAYDRCVVYMSELTHRANWVALNVVGLAKCQIRKIRTDENFRMIAEELEQAIKGDKEAGLIPFMVVGTAGTTDAGSIDPLHSIARIANENNLWMHVDAAIGGVCMVLDKVKHKMKGIELSDSISLDCHKIFFQPPGIGAILLRDGKKLQKCMSIEEPYYLREHISKYSPKDYTFEVSRPFRGVSLWFSLKVLGKDFFRKVVDEKLQLAEYAAEKLNEIEHMVVHKKPDLMVVLFRYEPPGKNHDAVNSEFIIKLKDQSEMYFDATVIKGRIYQRICFTSFRTHIQEVEAMLRAIKSNISKLE